MLRLLFLEQLDVRLEVRILSEERLLNADLRNFWERLLELDFRSS